MAPDEYLEMILKHGQRSAAETLGDEPAKGLSSAVWKRYYALERTTPRFHERTNRKLFVAAVPLVALYQTLRQDFALEQDPALVLAERMLRDAYAERIGPVMITAVNAMYQLRPVRSLLVKRLMKTNEPEGFRFEDLDEPETVMAFDVLACPIVNFAKQHGVPEIVPVICRLDDLVAEHLVGIELRRESTIGMGAKRCDFRYVRTK